MTVLHFRWWAAALLLTVLSPLPGPGRQNDDERRLEAHLRFLASDELAGRRVGDEGNQVAARYIAEQFRSEGLDILPGHGDYLLPVPLVSIQPAATGEIGLGDRTLVQGDDFVVLSGSLPHARFAAALADLSPGVALAEGSLRDRVVFAPLSNLRGGRGLERRRSRAAQAGAVALLDVVGERDWNLVRRFLSRPRIQPADEPDSGPDIVHGLVYDPDGTLLKLAATPDLKVSLRVDPTKRVPLRAHNVGALIRGSDSALAGEHIVLAAHFDHVGTDPGITDGDNIFNGARDNAMGVVALLEAARQLVADPPARSVILLAVNGEEQGLLGSRHYVSSPAVPLRDTVFVLNTDSGGFTETDAVTLIGTGRTTADAVIESACGRLNLKLLPDPAGANLFRRSDNVAFATEGVPALTLSPGMRRFDPQSMPHYHRPSDEAGPDFDYNYLHVFADAYAKIARALADHPGRIVWNEGQPFTEAARKLYGR